MLKVLQYVLFILSVVCAAFSAQIDRAFAGNHKLQRVILTFAAGVVLVVLISLLSPILF